MWVELFADYSHLQNKFLFTLETNVQFIIPPKKVQDNTHHN